MPPTGPTRHAIRRRFVGGPVDSRWWYWVAAVPLTFGLWVVTVAWMALAVGLGPVGEADPIARAADVSLVAFGVPFFALAVVFPFAVYADASAILEAAIDWRPRRALFTAGAAVGPAVSVGAVLYELAVGDGVRAPLWAVVAGFLLAVPVATVYLRRRHRHLGTP